LFCALTSPDFADVSVEEAALLCAAVSVVLLGAAAVLLCALMSELLLGVLAALLAAASAGGLEAEPV
jgi:ABC-type transport system involved in cytochrome c biogenesis permease subunit